MYVMVSDKKACDDDTLMCCKWIGGEVTVYAYNV